MTDHKELIERAREDEREREVAAHRKLQADLAAVSAERDRLAEALEWYGDKSRYDNDTEIARGDGTYDVSCSVLDDGGGIARAALGPNPPAHPAEAEVERLRAGVDKCIGMIEAHGHLVREDTLLRHLREARNLDGKEEAPETCPDCGRPKAGNCNDVIDGACPKWWATRDEGADEDCQRAAGKEKAGD